MGDHRVSIKIEFEMHGHKAKQDCWLNWSDNIPSDFSEWIEEQKNLAMEKWLDQDDRRERKKQKEIEKTERETLKRLKEKYE